MMTRKHGVAFANATCNNEQSKSFGKNIHFDLQVQEIQPSKQKSVQIVVCKVESAGCKEDGHAYVYLFASYKRQTNF